MAQNTSPDNSRADTMSMTSELTNYSDPDKAYLSIEDLTKLAKGDVVYKCHIAFQAYFAEYKHDKDNWIFGSHLFHVYFDGDGKRLPKGKPTTWGRSLELWIEVLSTGDREMSNGKAYCKINIRIIFRDAGMANDLGLTLKSGTIAESPTSFIAYFYSGNPTNTVKYLGLKKAETQKRWRVAADMQTEIEGDEGDAEDSKQDDEV